MGSSGLEPPTSCLSGTRSNHLSYEPIVIIRLCSTCIAFAIGGDDGIRTHDPLLAGQVLSQLSYTPIGVSFFRYQRNSYEFLRTDVGPDLFSRTVSSKVFSALHSLTSVFGMGTGGPCALKGPTLFSSVSGN